MKPLEMITEYVTELEATICSLNEERQLKALEVGEKLEIIVEQRDSYCEELLMANERLSKVVGPQPYPVAPQPESIDQAYRVSTKRLLTEIEGLRRDNKRQLDDLVTLEARTYNAECRLRESEVILKDKEESLEFEHNLRVESDAKVISLLQDANEVNGTLIELRGEIIDLKDELLTDSSKKGELESLLMHINAAVRDIEDLLEI